MSMGRFWRPFGRSTASEPKSEDVELFRRIARTLASRVSVLRQDWKLAAAYLSSVADGASAPSRATLEYISDLAVYAHEKELEVDVLLAESGTWKAISSAPDDVTIVVGAFTGSSNEFLAVEAYRSGGVWYDASRDPALDFVPQFWNALPPRP